MSIKAQIYIELLKICLQDEPKVTDKLINQSNGHIDWIDLLDFAARQGIIGVYWRGIELIFKSPTPLNKPTDDEVMEWWGEVNDIKKRNEDLFKKTAFVSDTFRKEGFDNCILKGQGNAMMYPNPYLRTSGDIDIWLKGTPSDISTYINQFFPDQKFGKLHIEFPILKNPLVEVHYTPRIFDNPFANKYLQSFFRDNRDYQMSHYINLPNNTKITTPTPEFNIIYQLTHIMQHIIYGGITLKQIIDYYYVLKEYKKRKDNNQHTIKESEMINTLKRTGMLRFSKIMMYIMHNGLGLKDEYLYTSQDKKGGAVILSSIIEEDDNNYKHPHNMMNLSKYNTVRERQRLKTIRAIQLLPYFPGETIWGLFGRIKNAM